MAIYFDHNATTAVDPRVYSGMQPYLTTVYGNPSSLHRFGRNARDAVNRAREQVAALVDVQPAQVIFTSGGTEANNTAVLGSARHGDRVLISAIEHPSVLELDVQLTRQGVAVAFIPPTPQGEIDLDALDELLEQGGAQLVSVMRANNETGVIQPTVDIGKRLHTAGALYHCDAVQAAGKIPLSFRDTGAALMSISSHKLYGPKGAGAIIIDKAVAPAPRFIGGSQEQGLRAGTENLAAIVGFGIAAELAMTERDNRARHCRALREQLEAGLGALPDIRIFGFDRERLPNTCQFSVPGYDGEALLMALDRHGIAVSSGSACSSGSGEPSHVLLAMGVDEATARGAIRVSLGKDNTRAEVDEFLRVLGELMKSLQPAMGGRYAAVLGQGS